MDDTTKTILIIGAIGAAFVGGGLYYGTEGGGVPRPPDAVSVEAVRDMRAATLGVPCSEELAPRCPGGMQPHPSSRDACLCWVESRADTVADEARTAAELPASARVRVVVCCDRDKARVIREPDVGVVGKDCRLVSRPLQDYTMGSHETDLTADMRRACDPCPVSAGSWAGCPDCLCAPGGCAAVCREVAGDGSK